MPAGKPLTSAEVQEASVLIGRLKKLRAIDKILTNPDAATVTVGALGGGISESLEYKAEDPDHKEMALSMRGCVQKSIQSALQRLKQLNIDPDAT